MNDIRERVLWSREFDRSYDVPWAALRAAGFVDISWHNDCSPSFIHEDDCDGDYQVSLWIEHPDPQERNSESAKRFFVMLQHDGPGTEADEFLHTDSLPEAIAKAQEYRSKPTTKRKAEHE